MLLCWQAMATLFALLTRPCCSTQTCRSARMLRLIAWSDVCIRVPQRSTKIYRFIEVIYKGLRAGGWRYKSGLDIPHSVMENGRNVYFILKGTTVIPVGHKLHLCLDPCEGRPSHALLHTLWELSMILTLTLIPIPSTLSAS